MYFNKIHLFSARQKSLFSLDCIYCEAMDMQADGKPSQTAGEGGQTE
jgi:hypothetical protein